MNLNEMKVDNQRLRALVVDDEPPARRRLIRLLEDTGGVQVVSQARSVDAIDGTVDFERDLDVVFLDINMPGQNGVDFARALDSDVPIVFVTAYAEHAVDAFGVSAVDYLLKPINTERLERSLVRVRDRLTARRINTTNQTKRVDDAFIQDEEELGLSVRGGLRLIRYDDILSILARDDYTEVVMHDGSSELVAVTMKSWEERLPETMFLRVHRSAIIARRRLHKLERSGSRWLAWLDGYDDTIPVSRSVAAQIRAELKQRLAVLG